MMPSSPEYSPFIPPLPSPYGAQQGVIPSPLSEGVGLPEDRTPRRDRMHARGPNPYPHPPPHPGNPYPHPPPHPGYVQPASWTPVHAGWTPPAASYGGPPGYPPFATPHTHTPGRPHGYTPGQPPYSMYGGPSPWGGHPPPPGHGPPPSTGWGPGSLPHGYGPTPNQPFHPMNGTPHTYAQGYGWGPGSATMGPSPMGYDDMGYGFPPPLRPKEDILRVDKWEPGKHYGPVLTPFQVAILDVKLHVNPLLGPGSDNADQPSLVYNLLFPLGAARRSVDPPSRSWTVGRLAPATWPRVTELRIVSREFPWVFEIEASRREHGVTCLDVIQGLYEHLQTIVPRHHLDELTGLRGEAHKRKLYTSYHYNRSTARDVPGGSLGEGVRKVDWLINNVMYDGITNDQKFVQEKLGISGPGWKGLQKKDTDKDGKEKEKPKDRLQSWPATLVLKLDVRYGDFEADRTSVVSDDTDTATQVSEAS